MTRPTLDHDATARGRVITQYTKSPKLLAYIAAIIADGAELEFSFQQIENQLDIDIAEGVNLDVIGDIVGISRIVPGGLPYTFFGFDDTGPPPAGAYGDSYIGGGFRFYEEGSDTATSGSLADIEFRLLIRAKIVKNHSDGTGESILQGLQYLFNIDEISVHDIGSMLFQIGIGKMLSSLEIAIINNLDILARPSAVRLAGKVMYQSNKFFGFSETPHALTFGEEGFPEVGGIFAEEF